VSFEFSSRWASLPNCLAGCLFCLAKARRNLAPPTEKVANRFSPILSAPGDRSGAAFCAGYSHGFSQLKSLRFPLPVEQIILLKKAVKFRLHLHGKKTQDAPQKLPVCPPNLHLVGKQK
jgi:hypothetical protein